ncbi:MAG TPA: transglycosylase SLT domain-containing protein, partial [Longilinea sp.]|nr:transglycosylase SLT domain-containing protein [Longilinea sp.]
TGNPMNNYQKAILPGLITGCLTLIGISHLLMKPDLTVNAAAINNSDTEATSIQAGGCAISPSYPESIQQWCSLITTTTAQYGVDANLIAAVMLQESGGDADAYSSSGAVGLLQVMPSDGIAASFMCVNGPCFANRPTMQELYDPAFNIDYGVNYLASLIAHFDGDIREALKSYGPKDIDYRYADIVLDIRSNHP